MSKGPARHERFRASQRIMNSVNGFAEKCAGLFLLGMVVAISISVFARLLYTYTGIPLSAPWAEELGRYMMIGSVFIGGAVAAYNLRLIGVDAFVGAVPDHIARWLRLVAHILTLSLALLLVWKSIRLIDLGFKTWSPAMEIPMAYVYFLMCIGCVLLCANTLMHVVGELLDSGPWPRQDSAELESILIQHGEGDRS
ncbi:TRAP transporter small permease [Alcaligenaceae bacterium]|nr:TRAP transporter small permease [Alcaligenaceae bacterium]